MKMKKAVAVASAVMLLVSYPGAAAFAEGGEQNALDTVNAAGLFNRAADYYTGEIGGTDADAVMTKAQLITALDSILDWSWDSMGRNYYTDLTYDSDGETYFYNMNIYSAMLKAVGQEVITAQEDKLEPWKELTWADGAEIISKAFGIEAGSDDSYLAAMAEKEYVPGDAAAPEDAFTYGDFADIIVNMAGDYGQIAEVLENGVVEWVPQGEAIEGVEADDFSYAAVAELKEGEYGPKYGDAKVIKVATVDTFNTSDRVEILPDSYTYPGGWIETDENGNIITEPTGTKDLTIILWVPEGTQAGDNVPLLIYTFGGSWISGSNQSVDPYLVRYMIGHGVAVASLSYRYEDEACFPYSMYDLQAQIRYLKINAEELGIDADNMGITGLSAGGYWSAELAVSGNDPELQDPGYVTFEGDQLGMLTELKYCGCQYGCFNMFNCCDYEDVRIRDYVDTNHQHNRAISNDPNVFGTYAVDLTPKEIEYYWMNGTDDLEGEEKELMDMMIDRFVKGSPIFNIDKDDPSFFFYHGTYDYFCPINQAEDMYGALCAAGVENNVFRVCEGMGHGFYEHPQYYNEMMEWMLERAGI